jgi:release factor glutamine methyltransferase
MRNDTSQRQPGPVLLVACPRRKARGQLPRRRAAEANAHRALTPKSIHHQRESSRVNAQLSVQIRARLLSRTSAKPAYCLRKTAEALSPPRPGSRGLFLCYNNCVTIKQSLIWATKILKKSKILSPALDAEILLSFSIKKSKEFLYSHSEKKLTVAQLSKFKKLIARRAKREPIAYITGHKYFFGLDFLVNKNVLIPRPETETLVEEALDKKLSVIIDVGTGSGAIAIALAHHLPKAKIFATEISKAALKVAKKNAQRHKTKITFLHGNLLESFLNLKSKIKNPKSLFIIANLPYLTTHQWQQTQPEIKKYEPRQALDGGKDGLKYYNQLINQINSLVTRYALRITSIFEIDPAQTKSITKLIHARFPAAKIEIKNDLAGRDRAVIFKI